MNIDRTLKSALLASLIIHGIIIIQLSHANVLRINKNKNRIEVSYTRHIQKPAGRPIKNTATTDNLPLNNSAKITARKVIPPQFFARDESSAVKIDDMSISGPILTKPILEKPEIAPIKKRVSIPSMGATKINTPSYINYYQIVREKIKRAAYQNYNGNQTGEIDVSFIISSSGQVKQVRLVEEKSTNNSILKDITLKSVYNASPFPEFPKELDYPQLSFNVIISFEVE